MGANRPRLATSFAITCLVALGGGSMGQTPPPDVPASSKPAETRIRFNFKKATFDQVIDFFSRASGLPVVRETDVPDGTLDYLAPEQYTIDEALEILNIILQAKGVMLRADDDMLYLQKMEDMEHENLPVFVRAVPDHVRPSDLITVVRPLEVALAVPLAEKLASMVDSYGSITALDQQNALVITETAAQVRRLLKIVEQLDGSDPEDSIEIIAVKHTRAADLMVPLKALLSKRVERFVQNKKGKMVKVEEQSMPGLNISHDERTNCIVAKGVPSRIAKLKESILLLDVPSNGASRSVQSFNLARLAPSDAAGKLNELFKKIPEKERPSVLALDEIGKVTVVGNPAAIDQARALLADIDGGVASDSGATRSFAVVALEHADPQSVLDALHAIFNGRQIVGTKIAPGPDGHSLVISGPAADVRAVEAILPALDRPAEVDRRVRVMRLTGGGAAETLVRAKSLYDQQVDASSAQWSLEMDFDESTRRLLVIGTEGALDRFAESLRLIETHIVERETRQIKLTYATPGEIIGLMKTMAEPLLTDSAGGYVAPEFTGLDRLDSLLVTALPTQMELIEQLVATLDRAKPGDIVFRVIPLTGLDVATLKTRADTVYKALVADETLTPAPSVEHDSLTGNLLVSGDREAVAMYEQAVAQARQLLPPARSGRLTTLANTEAASILETLEELIRTTSPVDPARVVPDPTIQLIARTNSLFVVAEPAQHQMIDRLVRQLDTFEASGLPPLRLLQVRTVQAQELADMLRKRYDARPMEERLAQPVDVDADPETNALIVTAPAVIFDEIKQLVENVNRDGQTQTDRETMLFSLKRARAADLAQALERLYPRPPMPLDRRGRPLPHLQLPKEVQVSADPSTNTLIVEAPSGRRGQFEALVEQLDRVQLPPKAELRTYHIERGDVAQIARTLTDLARRGVMSATPEEGTKSVEVIIQAEPVSRTLIVAGDSHTFEKTEQVLTDLQAVPVQRSLRVFEVTGTDPAAFADRAQRLFDEQVADIPDSGAISVEVDRENGALLVVADDESMIRFAQILNQLQASIGPPPQIRLIALEYADAVEVVEFLQDLVSSATLGGFKGPVPVIEAIERTNSVMVAAGRDLHDIIRELALGLDKPGSQDVPPLRILQLRTADAANLANALQRQYDKRHPDARKEQPVSISADPNTNTLIVAAHPEVLPEISAIVDGLNRTDLFGGEGREIRIFPLRVARAEALAKTIDEMYPQPPVPRDARGRPMPHLQQPREVVVRADAQTNSLIVDAPTQRLAGFEQLVEQLDRAQIANATEVRSYRILHADLDAIGRTLRNLAASGNLSSKDTRTQTSISIEPVSRTLVVAGGTDIFDRVEQVLGELDAPRSGPETALRFFRLDHARATAIVGMVEQVLLTRLAEEVTEAGVEGKTLLNISADATTNTLILSAPQALLPVAEALITELDHPSAGGGVVDVRIFPLVQADANNVATALREALNAQAKADGVEPTTQIAAEPSSNAVVVTAAPRDMQQAEKLIASLDGASPAGQLQVRTVFLKHARAEHVAPLVEQLLAEEDLIDMNEMPFWMRVNYIQAQMRSGVVKEPGVRVAADTRLNAVVISAPSAIANIAEQMIIQIDVDRSALDRVGRRSVRVLAVDNADVAALAENLDAVFAEDDGQAPPTIRVDVASNSLIVVASDKQFETIKSVVQSIDLATITTSRQMRLIPIDRGTASAAELAETLRRMLDRRSGSHGSGVEVITIEQLLNRRRKTSEAPPPEVEKDKRETSALPNDMGRALLALALAVPQADDRAEVEDDAPNDGPAITIAVDEETNSLIIIGAPRAIERARLITQQLLEQLPASPGRVRYIPLSPPADARTLVQLVNQTLGRLTPAGGKRGDVARRVSVLADTASNSVIVAANDHDFEVVGELIAALSHPMGTEHVVVKVYALETITAERAAISVRQLLDPDSVQTRRGGRRPNRQVRRMRDLAVTLLADGREIEGVFDPNRVRVAPDASANALIVMGPPEAISFVDEFITLLDQKPANTQATLKLYALEHGDAQDLSRTLRSIFRARHNAMRQTGAASALQPEFAADQRTNTLLVTASPEQLAEVDGLLDDLDTQLGDDQYPLRMISLAAAQPRTAADLLKQVVIGSDQARRASTLIVADDNTGVLLVRAPPEVMAEIETVLGEIDRRPTTEFKVRTIVLERADANTVANAMQRFYDDRARIASSGRGRRGQTRRVSIIGDPNSNTLLIAASDTDFSEIEKLAAQFDSPQASQALEMRIFSLKHAKATEIEDTVQELVQDLTWNQGPIFFGFFGRSRGNDTNRSQGTVAVRADPRLNALIVTGEGDKFAIVEQLIDVLDAPTAPAGQRLVKLYKLANADAQLVNDLVLETYTDTSRRNRWWMPQDPNELRVRVDERTNTLIIYATLAEHDEIVALVSSIDSEMATGERATEVLPIEFAEARDLARTLDNFLRDRARVTGGTKPTATISASESANTIIVAASVEEMATIKDLIRRLDQPDVAGDRVIEIIAVRDGAVDEIARIIDKQFGGKGGKGVIVTPDLRTNSLIVNAPMAQFAQAKALIERLDSPNAADETIIRTYALTGARADEAVRILSENLQLDAKGETTGITIRLEESGAEAVEVKARITADRRSNSLIVTATEESFPVIEALITKIDEVPPQSPIEYRIIPLKHALAIDVSFTLGRLLRSRDIGEVEPRVDFNRLENQLIVAATADQFKEIERIIDEIDQPSARARKTDFVPLRFAQAEQVQKALSVFYGPSAIEADTPEKLNTRIVADPATNSLVITADEAEWADIRALLENLDSEEYDASLQLRVIPLTYADARSVAQAINDAFAAEVQRGRGRRDSSRNNRRNQPAATNNNNDGRRDTETPTMLVEAEEWVRVSAEPQTNSVIISASLKSIRKVEQIIEQLDIADYAKLPPPRIIPVRSGSPVDLAKSLETLYEQSAGGRGRSGRTGLRIVGDPTSNSVIVRATDEEYLQIKALAEAIQDEASQQGLSVHVISLESAAASRVAAALRETYGTKAKQTNQAFSIAIDPSGNSLVIACTATLFAEVRSTIDQLDKLSPPAGQGIFIIDLQHVSPDEAESVIRQIGLDQPIRDDTVGRLVTEPIKVTPLRGRNSIIVIANPADRETIIGLLKAIDAEPALAESQVRLVHLRHAEAGALANILRDIFNPSDQQSDTALAKAVEEQVRRLSVQTETGTLQLDLTKPIQVIADDALNALVISSTEENVAALTEVVMMFDRLPITDAVTVQLFPLQNIAADQFARIVRDLFEQGKSLREISGTDLEGVPEGMVGRALLEEIALSVDDRTNTLIVAGKEEAVALVEVLTQRIDTDVATGWMEPRLIQLTYADATELAETLHAVLVEGSSDRPDANPLQRQVARMRFGHQLGDDQKRIESDLFVPMSRLLIRAETDLNALIVVGTPKNIEIVTGLVTLFDVEAAAPGASVRIYPIEHATAGRLAQTIVRLFDQQMATGAIRAEDRVVAMPDDRTNALVVTTSKRSFTVLESLLETLDAPLSPELGSIHRIVLENATASRVSQLVRDVMQARLERLRDIEPETAELQRVTIVDDPRTNSLIVAAGSESLEVVRSLIADLDRPPERRRALVNVMPVRNNNVERIAETVTALMQRRYAELPAQERNRLVPLIMTDPRANALLVAGSLEDTRAIAQLLEQLEETPSNPAIGIHVLPIKNTRADSISRRLQTLMIQRQQAMGRQATPSDRVSIQPDTASNSLIVAANAENLQVVKDLIAALADAERESAGGGEFEVIQLVSSRADQIIDLLEELYINDVNRSRGRDALKVTADPRINALLVSGSSVDIAALKRLAAQLDGTKPNMIVEIKYIPLESADCRETVGLIETILSGQGIGTRRRSQQATVLKYLRDFAVGQKGDGMPGPYDTMEVSAAIREAISLTPDVRTNTIIISAPAATMGMIESMIQDLDNTSTGSQNIRIFKLKNADALAMAEILTDLFHLRMQGDIYVLKPREESSAEMGGAAPGLVPQIAPDAPGYVPFSGTELTAVPDERQQLSLTVDARTNSLIVSGTPTYLELVDEVVNELDNMEANEREVFVFPLRNSVATEVSQVITTFVEAEQEKLLSNLSNDQVGAAARLLEREVTIVGDAQSNTVLVSASPRYMDRVKSMITELDVDPPQVLIQVLLAEITLDDSKDWAVDFSGQASVGSVDFIGEYGLGQLGGQVLNALGVPALTAIGNDFDLVVRALEAQGRLQVLSNPSIMAANNQPAQIQVGENIGRASSSALAGGGTQQTNVEYLDIGVILEVTPSINPDGFVRMVIRPEITDLTSRSTQVTEDLAVPILTKRVATTTVTVRDGQTIILGGLISERFEDRVRKVPLLGDIPLIGALFRSEFQQGTTTELLIVLTPHVITSPAESLRVQTLTRREIGRLSLPPDEKRQLEQGRIDPIKSRSEDDGPVGDRGDTDDDD